MQRVVVDGREDLVDGVARRAAAMPARSIWRCTRSLPRRLTAGFGPRDGFGRAGVVDGALALQAGDGLVDVVRVVPRRARRWRTCASDSSRRASIFRPSR